MRASPPHVPTYFAEKKLLETSKNQNLTFTIDITRSLGSSRNLALEHLHRVILTFQTLVSPSHNVMCTISVCSAVHRNGNSRARTLHPNKGLAPVAKKERSSSTAIRSERGKNINAPRIARDRTVAPVPRCNHKELAQHAKRRVQHCR